jgi:error-prone DNA polymerase
MDPMDTGEYCELHCKTNYSFLTGGSHPDELIERAAELGYRALAVTDENSLAGVVRAYGAARRVHAQPADQQSAPRDPLKLIVGAELFFGDASPVVVWVIDRHGYGNLAQLITTGRRRAPKGECWLQFETIWRRTEPVCWRARFPTSRGRRGACRRPTRNTQLRLVPPTLEARG